MIGCDEILPSAAGERADGCPAGLAVSGDGGSGPWLTLDRSQDGSETLTFGRRPSERDRLAMCDWLRGHGVDPHDVAVPGWLERNLPDRRVYYDGYVWETVAGERRIRFDREADCAAREPRYVQLESPPLPFPALDLDDPSTPDGPR